MDKLKLIKLAGIALIMQPYLAEGQGISKCSSGPNACSCETNMGTIQLKSKGSPYTAPDTNLPRYSYLWDPCKDFLQDSVTAGAIQQDSYQSNYNLEIGVHKTAFSDVVNGYAMFHMKSTDNTRTTNVKCVCGSGDTFLYESETGYYNYNFIFTSNDCCPLSGSSVSVGTILIIIFVSLVAAYILFGSLFQVLVRKARGREILPNITLWLALPGLLKDGFLFIVRGGRSTGYTKT